MSVDALLQAVWALSPEERTEFDTRLPIGPPPAVEVSPELAALLDERDAAYEANPAQVYTWDEVVAYAKRKK